MNTVLDQATRSGAWADMRAATARPRRRRLLVLSGLALALVAAFAVRVLLGDYTFTVPDFFRILFGEQMPVSTFILMESKLPRAVLAVLVGVALGSAGSLFQMLLRNPLASPDIVGVSLGASAAGIFAILTLDLRDGAVSAFAVLGAVVIAALVRWVAGTTGGYRLVLVGVGVAAAMVSVIQYLLARSNTYDVQLALRWLVGSVNNVPWQTIGLLALVLAVLLPLLAVLSRALPALEMGDDAAAGLGVGRHRTDVLLLVGVLLTAVAVAAAGPVAFVAFMAGPIARAFMGGRHSLLAGALVGAILMLLADYTAAYLIPGVVLPVGIVTGAVGGPFLLWLLARGAATGRTG
ncbi:iron complex transport system permease protein [Nocardioides exalbidus]|uniref:Iron complex transport system permease protein n=1 Tax=Nocardioides exalbidus TaxID=402596 RepID=A0A1H4MHC5_9ACTN|nr:iron ABC transporter permease [Nocardioides exalbidus]SEB82491.1 iron complex transport system permease protein [Nocardioides exalbidus]